MDPDAQIRAEISGVQCVVCAGEKWAFYPFCRSCSIRLQRAGMSQVLGTWKGILARDNGISAVLRLYDIARDYLIVRRREKSQSAEAD